jgi:UDP-MurNAc hydroxylase
MKHLKFLNHSCFVLTTPKTKIICDPWFNGTAFGNGWSLLNDNSHNINEIEFDYIWISHEHPDHFSIPTLLKLQKKCTFLFQETKDKKVKKFLESKGHKVIGLKHKEATMFGDLELTSIDCDGYDSSLLVKYPDGKILLNINDARVELNSHLANEIVPLLKNETLDILTFQFSYANWAGNKGDKKIPRFLQQEVDKKNDEAISKLKPKVILPFASFVYFSHEENFFWNDSNWLVHVFERYSSIEPTLIFPIPDKSINLNITDKIHYADSNKSALVFWKQKYKNLQIKDKIRSRSLSEIQESYVKFNQKINETNTFLKSAKNGKNFFINIRITDLDTTIKAGLIESSFEVVSEPESISVSSETIDFLFNHLFARGTVSINGRVSFNYDKAHIFFLFFFIPYANNIGIYFNYVHHVTKNMLMSILRTSVMMSINHSIMGLHKKVERDIEDFIGVFLPVANTDLNFEIFNEEPQNEDLKTTS